MVRVLLLDPSNFKREFKLPWREAGPPNHHDDKVGSDQQVVKKELSLSLGLREQEPACGSYPRGGVSITTYMW